MSKPSHLYQSLATRAYKRENEALDVLRTNEQLRKEFALMVHNLRNQLALSKGEFALLLETSASTVTRIEDAEFVPKLETVHKIKMLRRGINYAIEFAQRSKEEACNALTTP